jgi:hypothetical protein
VLGDRLHDRVRVAQHARRGGAHLHMVLSDGLAVVHSVEGSDLFFPDLKSATRPQCMLNSAIPLLPRTVNPHRRNLQNPRHLVHDRDGAKPVLSLTQVQQRHGRRLLVLRRIPLQYLIDQTQVLLAELERDRRVVLRRVSVLPRPSAPIPPPDSIALFHHIPPTEIPIVERRILRMREQM